MIDQLINIENDWLLGKDTDRVPATAVLSLLSMVHRRVFPEDIEFRMMRHPYIFVLRASKQVDNLQMQCNKNLNNFTRLESTIRNIIYYYIKQARISYIAKPSDEHIYNELVLLHSMLFPDENYAIAISENGSAEDDNIDLLTSIIKFKERLIEMETPTDIIHEYDKHFNIIS